MNCTRLAFAAIATVAAAALPLTECSGNTASSGSNTNTTLT